ncbi:MAG: polyprenol monophosphomannose synthase [Fimbriiglobus sp.]
MTVPTPSIPHKRSRLLVTLATYNEKDNIAGMITEIRKFAPEADILVIDDNSPDGTGKIVDELRAKDPSIDVLHRPGKLGLGTATLAAMNYAMTHGYELMQNLDADFSHPPRFLPSILKGMETHDIMIGSRYAKGGGTENWPLIRLIISRTVNTLVRFFFRMPISDASGAYRCYRVSKLKEAKLERTQSRGYSFQQEVLFRCHLAGAKLGETPIIFENRRAGKSKVNMKEALRSITMILWIGVTHFFGIEDYRQG